MNDRPVLTDTEKMDPVQFRIPASDTKGHSSRQWFRCQPGQASQIEAVIQSKSFPYRTKGDLLRHALDRHLKWLARTKPMPSVMSEVDAIIELVRDEEFQSDFVNVFDKLEGSISRHLGCGATGEARRLLLSVRSHINKMPDCYWKDRYINRLEEKFGHLLKSAPTMKFSKQVSDD